MTARGTTALVIALLYSVWPGRVALADEEAPLVPPAEPQKAAEPAATKPEEPKAAPDAAAARVQKLESEVAELREQIAASQVEQPERKLLSFWGFMDTTFGGIHFDNTNALYKIQAPYTATFFSSGVNVYAKSVRVISLFA
jgi:hypothetical protein